MWTAITNNTTTNNHDHPLIIYHQQPSSPLRIHHQRTVICQWRRCTEFLKHAAAIWKTTHEASRGGAAVNLVYVVCITKLTWYCGGLYYTLWFSFIFLNTLPSCSQTSLIVIVIFNLVYEGIRYVIALLCLPKVVVVRIIPYLTLYHIFKQTILDIQS